MSKHLPKWAEQLYINAEYDDKEIPTIWDFISKKEVDNNSGLENDCIRSQIVGEFLEKLKSK